MAQTAVDDYKEFLDRIHSKIHGGRFVGLKINRYTIDSLKDDYSKYKCKLTEREERLLRDIEEAYERTSEAKDK